MGDDVYHHCALPVVEAHGVTCLDCVGWQQPTGDLGLRVFLAAGSAFKGMAKTAPAGCASFSDARSINGGLVFAGQAPLADTTTFAMVNGSVELPISTPEPELFDGLNVCIAEVNGTPIAQIEAWIRYHLPFGLQALILVDRGKQKENKQLAGDLKALVAKSGLSRLLHVTSPVPLGRPNLPQASHPYNAPDAPGKDRMTDLDANSWTAPLGQLHIYEWARWRFLGRAKAVMNLELSDLLQPGADPFTKVHDSTQGVIQLLGDRIYPWRVRSDDAPSFGDHICKPFDASGGNRRWCLAPARLRPDNTWRLVRVVDAVPAEGESALFWRAMSLVHPYSNIAEIVPKTSLVEDAAVLKFMSDNFDHKPVRAPDSKVDAAPAPDNNRCCVITCMKNEGPFILEWLAYHRAIGVTDFLIYTNDCTDGTVELLDALQKRGLVQRRDNPFRQTGLKPQHAALQAAESETLLQTAGWAISMDVDEFINIHVGDGQLGDLFDHIGDANMVSLTWRLFGNSDVDLFEDAFLIDQFTQCAPELARKPHQAWGFKTLFRNIGIYKKLGVHRPKGLKPDLWDQIKWVNGSGRAMPKKLLRNGWRSTLDSYGYDVVTLNHYAVRSAESFLVKRDRGRVNHVARDQGLNYWFRMNNNWQEDRSIQTKRSALVEEYERLLSDPEISAAHAACVVAHRSKIDDLRAAETYGTFYQELTSERMKRLSRMHPYFGANVFISGPSSVPDDVVFKSDFPERFFFTVERDPA
ncbi:glycosyltransferase family 2 protein [Litoreibacter roseus]|uniref:Glycosyl transferase family 2 n=1 Tax=Litoreibacter roseus TaxID=2601869 RepID=A0A6N6JD36_9RHOB|nr:glycosyltransferase family 2 protein [Litoreibacter roseus]GFE64024.1 hypothetical protein KIN_10980 [Litoreibacter roseus]